MELFFSFYDAARLGGNSFLVSLWNTASLPLEMERFLPLGVIRTPGPLHLPRGVFAVCRSLPFLCVFVSLYVCLSLPFSIRFSRHLHPSFFKFTYLCLIPPLHTFLNSLRLYPCHVNNWWPVFDWSAIAKGWPESWGQHQCRVKSTTETCAPPACRTCRRHSLLMTYFYLNEIPLLPAAFPQTVGFI